MRTSQRIGVGFAVALVLVAIVGISSMASTRGFADANLRLQRTNDAVLGIERLVSHLTDAESAGRGFYITSDSVFLAPFHAARVKVPADLAAIERLMGGDSVQRTRIAALKRLAEARLGHLETALRNPRGASAPAEGVRAGYGKAVMDSIRVIASDMQSIEVGALAGRRAESQRRARNAETLIGAGVAFAFLLVLGSALMTMREFGVRRRAEAALRESQAQLAQFLDSLPIGAFVVDARGEPTFANTTALSMLGAASLRDLDHIPHETALPLWKQDDHGQLAAPQDPMRVALRGLAAKQEGLELHAGETRIPIEISAAPVFDSNGEVAYAIAAFADVTERQRARETMEAARQAAEDSNRAKSDFLARMSHELRTPLNSVIGFANILLKNKAGNLRDQDVGYLERVLDNGKHLLLLINDILDLSKIEAGKVQLEWERVDLAHVLTETVHQLEPQARSTVALGVDIPAGLEPVTSDSARLRQIIINLVGNALKFTQEGSVTVRVEASPGTKRPLYIKVRDTGIGIPRERLAAIFEAFEQADHTTSRQFGGTGLGLPISRALCELLGYTLSVSSDAGQGTEFCIDLRAEEKRRMTAAATGAADAAVAGNGPRSGVA